MNANHIQMFYNDNNGNTRLYIHYCEYTNEYFFDRKSSGNTNHLCRFIEFFKKNKLKQYIIIELRESDI